VSELGPIARFDLTVDEFFEAHLRGHTFVDLMFYEASELGDWALLWHLLGVGQGVVRDDGFARAVRLSAALGAESVLVNGVIKSIFRRARPVVEVVRPHRLRVPLTTSFPSGHASAAFCAATILSDGDRLAPLYYAAAVVAATSRIHVRIHHASDVVVGAAIGLTLGRIVRRLWTLPSQR
jgi:undecaprenyl-diphosphatase